MGTIIVVGVFVLLVLGTYLVQRKCDKVRVELDELKWTIPATHGGVIPTAAKLNEKGKKIIHDFPQNNEYTVDKKEEEQGDVEVEPEN